MNEKLRLRLQAYLDGELNDRLARRVADWVSTDPEAQALLAELKHTRSMLSDNDPVAKLPVSREFYWSQIEEKIARLDSTAARPRRWASVSWWARVLAPFGGVALLAAILVPLLRDSPQKPPPIAALTGIEVETSVPNSSVITFRFESEGITMVWVETN